ncbi:MAG: amidohydrolase family protein [Actinomycetota bacterium]|nr:amidohydrolase family protein [Actinomycetota bacterium]
MIVDAHTHMKAVIYGVTTDPKRQKFTWLLMRSYELLGFHNPLWRGDPPEIGRIIVALENQLRLSMGCKENLLRYMDINGIDRSIVCPIAPFASPREYLDICAGEPRLIPFTCIHPSQDWERQLKEAMQGGCKGLKIHNILQRIPPEDPFWFEVLEVFAPYGRPVQIHSGKFDYYIVKDGYAPYGDTLRFEKLIAAFPQVPFILVHSGLFFPDKALELAGRYDNVYLETSFQPLKVVREALRVAGRERVLFGSDWPESNQKYALSIAVKAAGEDAGLKERLTSGNILALVS